MEAPLVSLEEEFEEGPGDDGGTPQRAADPALAELESFSAEMMSFKSMEDLVQEFDEKLTVCFRNYDAATEGLAPVRGRLQAQEEEERLQDEEPPSLCLLQLCEKEEEELTERSEQDSGINEEPLLTAEQVIEELEELMQSSPDPEEEDEETEADPILLRELRAFSPAFNNNCSHEGMATKSSPKIGAIPTKLDSWVSQGLACSTVRTLFGQRGFLTPPPSLHPPFRELQRARRSPLSLLFSRLNPPSSLSRSPSDLMEGISSILHSGLRQTFGPSANEKQYLNTVIPYEKKGSPPSVEDLQMLTNILFAMKEGNEKVPTLLTDYILKGTCSHRPSPVHPSCILHAAPIQPSCLSASTTDPSCILVHLLCVPVHPSCILHAFPRIPYASLVRPL
uniref:Fasciculation and elongation protein zeta 1 n=1 Tax=Bubo bubo TaxID=30461 RepID=A0A8C0FJ16_BUBBB